MARRLPAGCVAEWRIYPPSFWRAVFGKASPHQSLAASLNQAMNFLSLCPMGCDRLAP